MARSLRIEFAGALYHVTSRGNERRPIFRSDRDRRTFLTFLGQAAKRFQWSVTAYVLMTNHFHLVIQTSEPNLSRGMQWLNGTYAGWFNHRHQRAGHLFQGRFHAFLVEKEAYFAELLRYVVLNPVRAKMVGRPEEYEWSSYCATAGLVAAPEWLDVPAAVAWLGADLAAAHAAYRHFVLAAVGCEDRLWDKVTNAIYLGGERWAKQMRKLVESRPRSTDYPKTQRAVGRPQMHTIVKTVAAVVNLSKKVISPVSDAQRRRVIAWIGWHEGLLTLRSIAAGLRLRSEGYVSSLIRRCQQEFATDHHLLAHLDATLAVLRT
jgi:REP element-mobilizing transposase RayT